MTGHMQSDLQREGGGRESSRGGWCEASKQCVHACLSAMCVFVRSQHNLAFGRWLFTVCLCGNGGRVCVFELGAHGHVREARRPAPPGTVCYHSASLIPSPHVCNLTW